jgi:putative endonuclease
MPAVVYLLKGASGRHYLGCTDNFPARLEQHQRGHTHTTARLGYPLEVIATRAFPTREEALSIERRLKSWHSPEKAREFLSETQ